MMDEFLNPLIAAQDQPAAPLKAEHDPARRHTVRQAVSALVASVSADVPTERRVPLHAALVAAERALVASAGLPDDARAFRATLAVRRLLALAEVADAPADELVNTDLLPAGHPLSTRVVALTAAAAAELRGAWYAADPRLAAELRPLVAAAHGGELGSLEREHAFLVLGASDDVPADLRVPSLRPLVAVALSWLGNSSAAKSARARAQRRDRNGKFAFEGGLFKSIFRGLDGALLSGIGRVVGEPEGQPVFELEFDEGSVPGLPAGIYPVPAKRAAAIRARLGENPAQTQSRLAGQVPTAKQAAEAVNVSDLLALRQEAPTGWTKKGKNKFVSDDGYEATVSTRAGVKSYELRRTPDAATGLEPSLVGKGDSWYDVQELAEKDSENYEKTVKARLDGGPKPAVGNQPYKSTLKPSATAKAAKKPKAAPKVGNQPYVPAGSKLPANLRPEAQKPGEGASKAERAAYVRDQLERIDAAEDSFIPTSSRIGERGNARAERFEQLNKELFDLTDGREGGTIAQRLARADEPAAGATPLDELQQRAVTEYLAGGPLPFTPASGDRQSYADLLESAQEYANMLDGTEDISPDTQRAIDEFLEGMGDLEDDESLGDDPFTTEAAQYTTSESLRELRNAIEDDGKLKDLNDGLRTEAISSLDEKLAGVLSAPREKPKKGQAAPASPPDGPGGPKTAPGGQQPPKPPKDGDKTLPMPEDGGRKKRNTLELADDLGQALDEFEAARDELGLELTDDLSETVERLETLMDLAEEGELDGFSSVLAVALADADRALAKLEAALNGDPKVGPAKAKALTELNRLREGLRDFGPLRPLSDPISQIAPQLRPDGGPRVDPGVVGDLADLLNYSPPFAAGDKFDDLSDELKYAVAEAEVAQFDLNSVLDDGTAGGVPQSALTAALDRYRETHQRLLDAAAASGIEGHAPGDPGHTDLLDLVARADQARRGLATTSKAEGTPAAAPADTAVKDVANYVDEVAVEADDLLAEMIEDGATQLRQNEISTVIRALADAAPMLNEGDTGGARVLLESALEAAYNADKPGLASRIDNAIGDLNRATADAPAPAPLLEDDEDEPLLSNAVEVAKASVDAVRELTEDMNDVLAERLNYPSEDPVRINNIVNAVESMTDATRMLDEGRTQEAIDQLQYAVELAYEADEEMVANRVRSELDLLNKRMDALESSPTPVGTPRITTKDVVQYLTEINDGRAERLAEMREAGAAPARVALVQDVFNSLSDALDALKAGRDELAQESLESALESAYDADESALASRVDGALGYLNRIDDTPEVTPAPDAAAANFTYNAAPTPEQLQFVRDNLATRSITEDLDTPTPDEREVLDYAEQAESAVFLALDDPDTTVGYLADLLSEAATAYRALPERMRAAGRNEDDIEEVDLFAIGLQLSADELRTPPAGSEIDQVPALLNPELDALKRQLQTQQAAFTGSELVQRYVDEGVQPKIREVAEYLREQEGKGATRAMMKFLPFAESSDPQEQEAFRAFLGLLHISDGGDGAVDTALDMAFGYYKGDLLADMGDLIERFGTYDAMVASRAAVARGDEDPDSPDSIAGAMSRLASQLVKPLDVPLFRGLPVNRGSQSMKDFTTVGSQVSFDLRPTSTEVDMAGEYSSIYIPSDQEDSVMLVLPAGSTGVDMRPISPIEDESEVLATGSYVVDKVDTTELPNGRLMHTVTLRDASVPETPNDYPDMPGDQYTPVREDATSLEGTDDPYSSPAWLSSNYAPAVLTDQLRRAIEDGSGFGAVTLPNGDRHSVSAEALRDALKTLKVDTDKVIKDISEGKSTTDPFANRGKWADDFMGQKGSTYVDKETGWEVVASERDGDSPAFIAIFDEDGEEISSFEYPLDAQYQKLSYIKSAVMSELARQKAERSLAVESLGGRKFRQQQLANEMARLDNLIETVNALLESGDGSVPATDKLRDLSRFWSQMDDMGYIDKLEVGAATNADRDEILGQLESLLDSDGPEVRAFIDTVTDGALDALRTRLSRDIENDTPADAFGPRSNAARIVKGVNVLTQDELSTPRDLTGYVQEFGTGIPSGSNEGGVYRGPSGDLVYMKFPKSMDHENNEVLASAIYRALGVNAAESLRGKFEGEDVLFSPIIDRADGASFYDKVMNDPEFRADVQDGFAVDALLANWDVAGLVFDNVIVDANGDPLRVDPGATFEFRARGLPKTTQGGSFGEDPVEIDMLRNPSINPQNAEVFGDMSEDQLVDSVARLEELTDGLVDDLVDTVMAGHATKDQISERKRLLKARRDALLGRYPNPDALGADETDTDFDVTVDAADYTVVDAPSSTPDPGMFRFKETGRAEGDKNALREDTDEFIGGAGTFVVPGEPGTPVAYMDYAPNDGVTRQDPVTKVIDPYFPVVRAYDRDGRIIGVFKWDRNGQIETVYTDPDVRRQGVATQMLNRAIEITDQKLDDISPVSARPSGKVKHTGPKSKMGKEWSAAVKPEKGLTHSEPVKTTPKSVAPKLSVPTRQDDRGAHYPERPLTTQELQDLKSGAARPPALPFVVRDTDSGDVHYYDTTGARRWGQFGAAGAVVVADGPDGEPRILMVQRADSLSTDPGKWAFPGGAHATREDSQTPGATAMKELAEETGLDSALPVVGQYAAGVAPDWKYEYSLLQADEPTDPSLLGLDPESQQADWLTEQEIRKKWQDGEMHSAIDEETFSALLGLIGGRASAPVEDEEPQAADSPPPPGGPPGGPPNGPDDDGTDSGGGEDGGPTGPGGSDGPNVPPDGPPDDPEDTSYDASLPDVEPDLPLAEIGKAEIVSMRWIKRTWPNHTVLDNGDVVVSSHDAVRDGQAVRRDVVIKRNAVTGNNETYSVYVRETNLATGETRVAGDRNKSHSDRALRNQVRKHRGKYAMALVGGKSEGKFRAAKPEKKPPQPKVLRDFADPEVQALLDDATTNAPSRSEEENLRALIAAADAMADTPENRDSLAERMAEWEGYFGSGEAVRSVFDAVQAGDGEALGQMRKVVYLSKNGVEVTLGMRVSWTDPKTGVERKGEVVRRATAISSRDYGFTDYVYVRFDDRPGKYIHRVSDRLTVLGEDDNPLARPDGGAGAPSGEALNQPTTPVDAAPAGGVSEASADDSDDDFDVVITVGDNNVAYVTNNTTGDAVQTLPSHPAIGDFEVPLDQLSAYQIAQLQKQSRVGVSVFEQYRDAETTGSEPLDELLDVLIARRNLSGGDYLATIKRVAELTVDPDADDFAFFSSAHERAFKVFVGGISYASNSGLTKILYKDVAPESVLDSAIDDVKASLRDIELGKEDGFQTNSLGGMYYRALAMLSTPNVPPLYRGLPLDVGSNTLLQYTTVGSIVNFSARPASDERGIAEGFAGIGGQDADVSASVILKFPSGSVASFNTKDSSTFASTEAEHLVTGRMVVESVDEDNITMYDEYGDDDRDEVVYYVTLRAATPADEAVADAVATDMDATDAGVDLPLITVDDNNVAEVTDATGAVVDTVPNFPAIGNFTDDLSLEERQKLAELQKQSEKAVAVFTARQGATTTGNPVLDGLAEKLLNPAESASIKLVTAELTDDAGAFRSPEHEQAFNVFIGGLAVASSTEGTRLDVGDALVDKLFPGVSAVAIPSDAQLQLRNRAGAMVSTAKTAMNNSLVGIELGKEDGLAPDSLGGLYYTLLAMVSTPNSDMLYRGLPLNPESNTFRQYTTPGSVVSFAARPATTERSIADEFAGLNVGVENMIEMSTVSVVLHFEPGNVAAYDTKQTSLYYAAEQESLVTGHMVVDRVEKVTTFEDVEDYKTGETDMVARDSYEVYLRPATAEEVAIMKAVHEEQETTDEGQAADTPGAPGVSGPEQDGLPAGSGLDRRADTLRDRDGNVVGQLLEHAPRDAALAEKGLATPDLFELSTGQGALFHEKVAAAKASTIYGASVDLYDVEQYDGESMRLFLTEDGLAGFALDGDNVISVFRHNDGPKHVGRSLVANAVAQGGRRLDAFDTVLPPIYAAEGFRPVARVTFDPDQAPAGWDYDTYKDFNNARPDIVFMAYDPTRLDSTYEPAQALTMDYETALTITNNFVNSLNAAPASLADKVTALQEHRRATADLIDEFRAQRQQQNTTGNKKLDEIAYWFSLNRDNRSYADGDDPVAAFIGEMLAWFDVPKDERDADERVAYAAMLGLYDLSYGDTNDEDLIDRLKSAIRVHDPDAPTPLGTATALRKAIYSGGNPNDRLHEIADGTTDGRGLQDPGGMMLRLLSALTVPNADKLYRGVPMDAGSPELARHTTVGGLISFDGRPTSRSSAIAEGFAGLYHEASYLQFGDHTRGVVYEFPKGTAMSYDTEATSQYAADEQEELVTGTYRVAHVDPIDDPFGNTYAYRVLLEPAPVDAAPVTVAEPEDVSPVDDGPFQTRALSSADPAQGDTELGVNGRATGEDVVRGVTSALGDLGLSPDDVFALTSANNDADVNFTDDVTRYAEAPLAFKVASLKIVDKVYAPGTAAQYRPDLDGIEHEVLTLGLADVAVGKPGEPSTGLQIGDIYHETSSQLYQVIGRDDTGPAPRLLVRTLLDDGWSQQNKEEVKTRTMSYDPSEDVSFTVWRPAPTVMADVGGPYVKMNSTLIDTPLDETQPGGPALDSAEAALALGLPESDEKLLEALGATEAGSLAATDGMIDNSALLDSGVHYGHRTLYPGRLVRHPDGSVGMVVGVRDATGASMKKRLYGTANVTWLSGARAGTTGQHSGALLTATERVVHPEVAKKVAAKFVAPGGQGFLFEPKQMYKKMLQKLKTDISSLEISARTKETTDRLSALAVELDVAVTRAGGGEDGPGRAAPDDAPRDWNYSAEPLVASLADALGLTRSDPNLVGKSGVPVLVDSSDVEDAVVMVHTFVNNDTGEVQTALRFKLTSWAGDDLASELEARKSMDTAVTKRASLSVWKYYTGEGHLRPDERKRPDLPNAMIKESSDLTWNTDSLDQYDNGSSYGVELYDADGNSIGMARVHRATADPADGPPEFTVDTDWGSSENSVSLHNLVQVELVEGVTFTQVQAALSSLGIKNAAPASPEALRVIKENKIITLLAAKVDGRKNLAGETRAEVLKRIEEEWGLTADDITVEPMVNGGAVQYLAPRSFGERMSEVTSTKHLTHHFSANFSAPFSNSKEQAEGVAQLITQSRLTPTVDRWTTGINVSGMSSEEDVRTPAGGYIFFNAYPELEEKWLNERTDEGFSGVSYNLSMAFDAAEVFRRLDWYFNPGDYWGRLRANATPVVELAEKSIAAMSQTGYNGRASSSGELLVKYGVDWSTLIGLTGGKTMVEELIEWFERNRGGRLPDGRLAREVFGAE